MWVLLPSQPNKKAGSKLAFQFGGTPVYLWRAMSTYLEPRMKFNFNNRGILAKLLLPISVIFILGMVVLVSVIIEMQSQSTSLVEQTVNRVMQSTAKSVQSQFAQMENGIIETMQQNLAQASETLSQNTSSELSKVEADIITDLERNLLVNAQSIASLMAQVAPRAILANNFADLVSYVKSVSLRPDVIYAFYLKPNGNPITRYVNRKDPKIKAYLKTGTGKKKHTKVLNASSADSSVLIVEKPMSLEGKSLGKVLLCMDKSSILAKKNEVEERFNTLAANNDTMINTALTQVLSVTGEKMQTTLKHIAAQSDEAWKKIGRDIDQVALKATSRMKMVLMGIGVVFGLIMLSVIGALTLLKVTRPVNAGRPQGHRPGRRRPDHAPGSTSKDEVGELARWFNTFIEKLQGIIKDIAPAAWKPSPPPPPNCRPSPSR
jgi:HAMP domain-containing protein